jgi:hypothetical protein
MLDFILAINHPLIPFHQSFLASTQKQLTSTCNQIRTKKKALLDEIAKLKHLIQLGERSNFDTDRYLDGLEKVRSALNKVDPQRESYNDIMMAMQSRSVGMQGEGDIGYDSEPMLNISRSSFNIRNNSVIKGSNS